MTRKPQQRTDRFLPAAVAALCLALAVSPALCAPLGTSGRDADPPCFDNSNRYVDCGNGTVTDAVTGLIWLQDANCYGLRNYATANERAAVLASGTCGLTDRSRPGDWRLPTKAEWETTIERAVELGCWDQGGNDPPSLTNDPGTACLSVGPSSFSGVQSTNYWTSSTLPNFPSVGLFVDLSFGGVFSANETFTYFVWPVRGGQ